MTANSINPVLTDIAAYSGSVNIDNCYLFYAGSNNFESLPYTHDTSSL